MTVGSKPYLALILARSSDCRLVETGCFRGYPLKCSAYLEVPAVRAVELQIVTGSCDCFAAFLQIGHGAESFAIPCPPNTLERNHTRHSRTSSAIALMEFLIGDCPWLPSATNAGGRKRRLKEVTWLDQPMPLLRFVCPSPRATGVIGFSSLRRVALSPI